MATWSSQDQQWMARALHLARQGEGYTNPNPMVGAVVVLHDRVVGEGFTAPYGGHHAEWVAMEQAGGKTQDAALYVNWEPCVAYEGKQTPPCANRIAQSGVRRVVIACADPHPQVHQRGIQQLKEAGLQVEVGLMAEESRLLNEVSLVYHQANRPFVCLKWAMTLDGHIATSSGDSRWITNKLSRTVVHQLRHRYAAILVGVNTVLKDDPSLTVRHIEGKDPWRIVLDSYGKTPPTAKILNSGSPAPTVIATTSAMPSAAKTALTDAGARVWPLADHQGKISLKALMAAMKKHQLDSVLVEGGSEVHGSFVRQALFDKVEGFVAPKLSGGRKALPPVGGAGFEQMDQALQLERTTYEDLEGDLHITAYRA